MADGKDHRFNAERSLPTFPANAGHSYLNINIAPHEQKSAPEQIRRVSFEERQEPFHKQPTLSKKRSVSLGRTPKPVPRSPEANMIPTYKVYKTDDDPEATREKFKRFSFTQRSRSQDPNTDAGSKTKCSMSLRRVSSNIAEFANRGIEPIKGNMSAAEQERKKAEGDGGHTTREDLEARGRRQDCADRPTIPMRQNSAGSIEDVPIIGHLSKLHVVNPDEEPEDGLRGYFSPQQPPAGRRNTTGSIVGAPCARCDYVS